MDNLQYQRGQLGSRHADKLIDRFIVGMDCSFTQPSELVTIESHRPASPLPLSVKAAGG
jgi:hypothetical protein